ncbi:hypothetical protein I2H31_21565 [Hymenobacter sp. BT662]|uniref:DUF3592 domain-containing protein n=2 Tax=Hymenobacter ruricola TaxID=2791023 RepID=A0ABS0I9R3_9BACT|nr:hypothetical protein [Hymenobacter ruricola]
MTWLAFLVACLPGSVAYAVFDEIKLASTLLRNGIEQEGVIVSQRKVSRGRNGTYLIPKVRFTTLTGSVIEGESVSTEWFFDTRTMLFADKVEFFDDSYALLRYDANNPKRFLFIQELDQTRSYWALALAGLLTVGMVLVGLLGTS